MTWRQLDFEIALTTYKTTVDAAEGKNRHASQARFCVIQRDPSANGCRPQEDVEP